MYKVLIVDDEEHVREAIKVIGEWEQLGVSTIYEASDGLSAYEIIMKDKPQVVISDMKMPYVDGAALLKKCENILHSIKFIIVSGYDDFEYMRQGIRSGIVDYILKPINPVELNESLRRAFVSLKTTEGIDSELMNCPSNFTAEIKNYIDQNYCSEISLELFAKRYFMTKEYILKKFKEEYGYGIYGYVMAVRMEKAKILVGSSGLRVQEISSRLGFNDSNYFSKAFKKYWGFSPKDCRENK